MPWRFFLLSSTDRTDKACLRVSEIVNSHVPAYCSAMYALFWGAKGEGIKIRVAENVENNENTSSKLDWHFIWAECGKVLRVTFRNALKWIAIQSWKVHWGATDRFGCHALILKLAGA